MIRSGERHARTPTPGSRDAPWTASRSCGILGPRAPADLTKPHAKRDSFVFLEANVLGSFAPGLWERMNAAYTPLPKERNLPRTRSRHRRDAVKRVPLAVVTGDREGGAPARHRGIQRRMPRRRYASTTTGEQGLFGNTAPGGSHCEPRMPAPRAASPTAARWRGAA